MNVNVDTAVGTTFETKQKIEIFFSWSMNKIIYFDQYRTGQDVSMNLIDGGLKVFDFWTNC